MLAAEAEASKGERKGSGSGKDKVGEAGASSHPVGGRSMVPEPPPMDQRLVCLMPAEIADEMVAFHQNCIFDANQHLKRDNM